MGVDEALVDKAPKYDVVVANSRIELSMNKERCMKEFQKLYERLDLTNKRLEMCIESVQEQPTRVRQTQEGSGTPTRSCMRSAVKRTFPTSPTSLASKRRILMLIKSQRGWRF